MDRLKKYHDEPWHTPKGRLIRDIVYATDGGLITTIAFLAGMTASMVQTQTVFLAGLIQVISGSVAVFFGAFISTKAQVDFFTNQIERERREIIEMPEKETMEIVEIFQEMGFKDNEIEVVKNRIISDKDLWLKFMIREEIGLIDETMDNPIFIGFLSGISYLAGAVPVLLPFWFFPKPLFALNISLFVCFAFLFFVGIIKTTITKVRWHVSAIETVVVGILSAAIGFSLSRLIAHLIK